VSPLGGVRPRVGGRATVERLHGGADRRARTKTQAHLLPSWHPWPVDLPYDMRHRRPLDASLRTVDPRPVKVTHRQRRLGSFPHVDSGFYLDRRRCRPCWACAHRWWWAATTIASTCTTRRSIYDLQSRGSASSSRRPTSKTRADPVQQWCSKSLTLGLGLLFDSLLILLINPHHLPYATGNKWIETWRRLRGLE
jgi:hypothetical protein